MAEEQRPGSGTPPQADRSGDDWGDDWESAFQNDDPVEGQLEDEFTIPDIDDTLDDDGEEGESDGAEEEAGAESDRTPLNGAALLRNLLAFSLGLPRHLRGLPTLPGRLLHGFIALSTPGKIKLLGAMLFVGLAAAIAIKILTSPSAPEVVLPEDPFGLKPQTAQQDQTTTDTLQEGQTGEALESPIATPASPDSPPPFQRHRLELSGFFIPLDKQDDRKVSRAYLNLDLDITLRLNPEQTLGPELVPLLRYTILNFYLDQEAETLRRYSLARGEMLRDLRLRLEESHPELAIEGIAFNRYWIK